MENGVLSVNVNGTLTTIIVNDNRMIVVNRKWNKNGTFTI